MSYHVGQEVVCIHEHPKLPELKKNNTYTIQATMAGPCEHCRVLVDVGFPAPGGIIIKTCYCNVCHKFIYTDSNISWLNSLHFAPLDSVADISELTTVLESLVFDHAI